MKFCLKNIISKLFAEYQVSHFLQNGVVTSHLLSSLLEIILFLIHLFNAIKKYIVISFIYRTAICFLVVFAFTTSGCIKRILLQKQEHLVGCMHFI